MVDPVYQLQTVSESYQESNYQSVESVINSNRTFTERIPQIGVLSFGSINKNQSVSIDLGDKGIASPIMICSVYAFSSDSLEDEITFNIYHKLPDGNIVRVATDRIKSSEMPYEFPYGAILTPSNIVEIKAQRSLIDNCFVYLRPVIEIFRISAN